VNADEHSVLVRRFYDAFNIQDLDRFVDTLHPDVELQTQRGLRGGRDEARDWATRDPHGGLEQRLVLEEIVGDPRSAHLVALYRKQWWWRETERCAHQDEMAALFTFRDGLIARWQPFEDRSEALLLLERLESSA
jgi:ketosteroid isomerase-like protein